MAASDFFRLAAFLLGTFGFIIFLVVDIHKAFKKGAQWVPGGAMVLSALTVQIMNFVENQSNQAFLGQNSDSLKTLEDEAGKNSFIMMHSSRVMLCVLVALFIPGMARARYEEKVNKILALGFSVILDILSELLTIYRRFTDHSTIYSLNGFSWYAFLVSGVLISASLIWLILLLFCATGASKSIRIITTQRIPFILAKLDDAKNYWKGIENQVVKSWIVARVCSPESIIAKSMLVSSAALVVTVCILSSVIRWIVHGPVIQIPAGAESLLKFIITILEVVFILIGWAVICWRSLTSMRYYGRWEESSWLQQFMVEDFWTRHIIEKLKGEKIKNSFQIEDFCKNQMEAKESKKILKTHGDIIESIPQIKWTKGLLLRCLLLLQYIVVFVSKVSAFFIEVTFYNKVIRKIASKVFTDHYSQEAREYAHILKNLKNVNVVGESPENVFVTNRKSIKQALKLCKEGYIEGKEDCNCLINFLKDHIKSLPTGRGEMSPPLRVGVRGCLQDRRTTAEDEAGLKFLCKCDSGSHLEEAESYFLYMREGSWSWKLTAVSLIRIIVCLCPQADVIDSVYAYLEVWQLMDLVDEWDPETDSLLSKAADREFNTLFDGTLDSHKCCPDTMSMDQVAGKITQFAETKRKAFEKESKKLAGNKNTEPRESIMEDKEIPVDWELLAGAIALYKLCKGMDCNAGTDLTELKKELTSSLAHIMAACIDKVGIALVDKCRKWAQNLEEEKLLQAIYIAGKSRGLVEALGTPDESSMV